MGDYFGTTRSAIRRAIGQLLHPVGFDLIRLYRMPRATFVGLPRLPIRTIVDVGANRGQFAREALALFPNARLICFEPQRQPFEELRRLAAKRPNIIPVNLALGDTEGEASMQVHLNWDFSSSLLATTQLAHQLYPFQEQQSTITVPLTTMDRFFATSSVALEPEILVKIDAQGYDDRVIRGGTGTLGKARACIVEINLDRLYETQGSFRDIFALLGEMGYHYAGNMDQSYATDGHVVFIDAVFER